MYQDKPIKGRVNDARSQHEKDWRTEPVGPTEKSPNHTRLSFQVKNIPIDLYLNSTMLSKLLRFPDPPSVEIAAGARRSAWASTVFDPELRPKGAQPKSSCGLPPRMCCNAADAAISASEMFGLALFRHNVEDCACQLR
jgi:hypothetical protein